MFFISKISPRLRACSAFALGFFLATQQDSKAQGLLDYNFNAGHPFNAGPGSGITMASSFQVGAQNVNVSSLTFLFQTVGSAPSPFIPTAYIFSDSGNPPGSGGQPVSLLGSAQLSFPSANLPYQFYTFTFANEISLQAGTKYWAAIGIPTPGGTPTYIGETRDLVDFSGHGITPILSIANAAYPTDWNPIGFYGNNSPTETLVFRIDGTVVPEPKTFSLLVVAALLFYSRFLRGGRTCQI